MNEEMEWKRLLNKKRFIGDTSCEEPAEINSEHRGSEFQQDVDRIAFLGPFQPRAKIIKKLLSKKRSMSDTLSKDPAEINSEHGRSEFQRDADRIIFSRPFRRLAKKTQVHPMSKNDHMHTRLTHSLEVAHVGRTLGTKIGYILKKLNQLPENYEPYNVGEIVHAACFAHDIGNTPFGHAGEEAIKEYLFTDTKRRIDAAIDDLRVNTDKGSSTPNKQRDLKVVEELFSLVPHRNFEANAHGFRIITKLQHHRDKGGLQLTYATLGAFMKYPYLFQDDGTMKFNVFPTEKAIFKKIAEELGLIEDGEYKYHRHPLVYLVEAADDLCNRTMDLEDGYEAKLIGYDEIYRMFKPLLFGKRIDEILGKHSTYSRKQKIGYIRAKVMQTAIEGITQTFEKNIENLLKGKGIPKRFYDGKLLDINKCQEFDHKNILINSYNDNVAKVFYEADKKVNTLYRERRKVELETGSFFTIEVLLKNCLDALFVWLKSSGSDFNTMQQRAKHIFAIMGDERPQRAFTIQENFRRCIDFVAGMTDDFATRLAQQFQGAAR